MFFSVIVPIYKVEKYLDLCLKSIAQQGLSDYEVILVDDCSPDKSRDICQEWENKDHHFKTIHHSTNLGLSMARNSALEVANGEYITFIDSDDYIAPDTLSANLKALEDNQHIDILEYPILVNHGTKEAYQYQPGKHETVTYLEWIRAKGYLHSYACNKIFKRKLWDGIRFPQGKLFEDMFTIPSVMKRANLILRSDKGLYYYCNRKGSISKSVTPQGIADLLKANLNLFNELSENKYLTDNNLDDLYLHICDPQIVQLQLGGDMIVPERKISFKRALLTQRPFNYRIKAILKALSGRRYCTLVANTRKFLKR